MKFSKVAVALIVTAFASAAVAQIPNPPPRPNSLPRAPQSATQPSPPAPQPPAQQSAQPAQSAAPTGQGAQAAPPPAAAASTAQPPAAQNPATDMESGDGQPVQARCAAYRDAFETALTRFGRNGVSPEFIERSNAFVASNCAGERNVCPRSNEELRIANVIVMRAVGTTGGTFMPFACPSAGTK